MTLLKFLGNQTSVKKHWNFSKFCGNFLEKQVSRNRINIMKLRYSFPKQVQKNESAMKKTLDIILRILFSRLYFVLDIIPDFDLDFFLLDTLAFSRLGTPSCKWHF